MAKKNKRQRDPRTLRYKPKAAPAIDELPHFYTQDGRKIKIKMISILEVNEAEINIRNEFEELTKPPTYQTVTAGGTVIDHEITEKSITVKGDEEETARRQAAWDEHLQHVAEMEAEISKVTLSIIMEGIDEAPEDDSWIARRKARHLSIPPEDANPDDVMLFWKTAVLLRNNVADIVEAQTEILVLSTSGLASREDIEAGGNSFPDSLPGESESEADSDTGIDQDPEKEKDLA